MNAGPPATDGTLDEMVCLFAEAHGLDISRYDEGFLRKMIAQRMAATGAGTPAAYGGMVAGDRAEAEMLFSLLRVNHSEFFRNPLTFAVLGQLVLPGLGEAKRKSGGEIRVWSAGCASGQEAWSLAILLEELAGSRSDVEQASRSIPFPLHQHGSVGVPPASVPGCGQDARAPLSEQYWASRPPGQTGSRDGRLTSPGTVPYRIFATDLADPEFARAGVYCAEAVGNVRARHLREYFSRQGESYSVVPRLRARVDFSAYDLLDGSSESPAASIYGGFDLILCCNVLLYYRPEARGQIMDKVCRDLSPGGYFVTGEVERAIVAGHPGLLAAFPPAAVFQKG